MRVILLSWLQLGTDICAGAAGGSGLQFIQNLQNQPHYAPSDTLLPPDVPLLQKAEFQLHPACPQLLSSESFSHLTLVPSKPGFAISMLSLCSDSLYCHCYWTKLGSTCLLQQSQPTDAAGCGEGKGSFYCRAPGKESRQLILKRPKVPEGFQGNVFKDRVRCVISSRTFFW